MYRAILAGVLDLDYAPKSMRITVEANSRRIWMNISQEANSAVDDLRDVVHEGHHLTREGGIALPGSFAHRWSS